MTEMTSLIQELDGTVGVAGSSRCHRAAIRLTDLFLDTADRLSGAQVDLFDDVLGRLCEVIELRARAELAHRFAVSPYAPRNLILSFAHDEIVVAAPVLSRSPRLDEADLVSVARARGSEHMMAICERSALPESLTDCLIEHGDARVRRKLAGHAGARLSQSSLANLVTEAARDHALHALLRARRDLGPAQLQELIAAATETVRHRLEPASSDPDSRAAVAESLAAAADQASLLADPLDHDRALAHIAEIVEHRPLCEKDVHERAVESDLSGTICTLAALSGLSLASIESVMNDRDAELILMIGKALRWSWTTVEAVLGARRDGGRGRYEAGRAKHIYAALAPSTAEKVVGFLRVRETSGAAAVRPRRSARG